MVDRALGVLLALVILAGACSGAATPAPDPPAPPSTAPSPTSRLDAALARHWSEADVTPAAEVEDLEFLRRVTVDLWGRIPRPDEVRAFAGDEGDDRRARLVDTLLADPQWSAHWADITADVLLAAGDRAGQARLHDALQVWLADGLAKGRGWDEVTTDLLTATGDPTEGPGAFLAVHGSKGRVEALTGQTARVFLGLSLQCAQCHDHPNDDRYTQRDFYGLAAAFARTRARRARSVDGPRIEIVDRPRGQMRMPRAEDGPGERTGLIVEPRVYGLDLTARADETRRQALARAIVASPLLDVALVDRVWAKLMSHGFAESLDDLGAAGDPRQPAVLVTLAEEFRAHDRDVRWLLRTIVLSSAYQRASTGPEAGGPDRRAAFAQFPVRPLRDDELLASLLVATGVDSSTDRRLRRRVRFGRDKLRRQFAFVFDDDDEMATGASPQATVGQALLLLNGALTSEGIVAQRDTALDRILAATDDPEARIDALVLTTLSRWPSPARRRQLAQFVASRGHSETAYEDVMHALLVGAEFSTNH
jgi:hypothetical protein